MAPALRCAAAEGGGGGRGPAARGMRALTAAAAAQGCACRTWRWPGPARSGALFAAAAPPVPKDAAALAAPGAAAAAHMAAHMAALLRGQHVEGRGAGPRPALPLLLGCAVRASRVTRGRWGMGELGADA